MENQNEGEGRPVTDINKYREEKTQRAKQEREEAIRKHPSNLPAQNPPRK